IFPVAGDIETPTIACPVAIYALHKSGTFPITGSPSGVIGLIPTQSSSVPLNVFLKYFSVEERIFSIRSWFIYKLFPDNSIVPPIRIALLNGVTPPFESPRYKGCLTLGDGLDTVILYPLPAVNGSS